VWATADLLQRLVFLFFSYTEEGEESRVLIASGLSVFVGKCIIERNAAMLRTCPKMANNDSVPRRVHGKEVSGVALQSNLSCDVNCRGSVQLSV